MLTTLFPTGDGSLAARWEFHLRLCYAMMTEFDYCFFLFRLYMAIVDHLVLVSFFFLSFFFLQEEGYLALEGVYRNHGGSQVSTFFAYSHV